MSLELTTRDLALLWITWQNRLMAPRQYLRRLWPNATQQAASLRLSALRNDGLLNRTLISWNVDRHIYTITAAGNRALVEAGLLDPTLVHDFPRRPQELTNALQHDLSVVDLRIAFEATGAHGSTWVSDHQLRQARPQRLGNSRVADGMFNFEAHGRQGRGVLEFERQSYRRPKMASVLARLRADHGRDTIFFVARSEERAERVRAWAAEAGTWRDRPRNFLVASFEAAFKGGLDAGFVDLTATFFTNCERENFPLGSYCVKI